MTDTMQVAPVPAAPAADLTPVTVVTTTGATVAAGRAEICGEASTREADIIDGTRSWCRPAGVDLQEG